MRDPLRIIEKLCRMLFIIQRIKVYKREMRYRKNQLKSGKGQREVIGVCIKGGGKVQE